MSDLIRRSDAIRIMACEMYAEAQSQGYEVDSIEACNGQFAERI